MFQKGAEYPQVPGYQVGPWHDRAATQLLIWVYHPGKIYGLPVAKAFADTKRDAMVGGPKPVPRSLIEDPGIILADDARPSDRGHEFAQRCARPLLDPRSEFCRPSPPNAPGVFT